MNFRLDYENEWSVHLSTHIQPNLSQVKATGLIVLLRLVKMTITVRASIDGIWNERNFYEFMWIFLLRFHLVTQIVVSHQENIKANTASTNWNDW